MKLNQIRSTSLSKLAKAATDNGGHLKIENEPYMPLCVEWIGDIEIDRFVLPALSVCHYGEQNGDLMRDPDICFAQVFRSGVEYFIPYSFRDDYQGVDREFITETTIHRSEQRHCALFTIDWMKNLVDQGFLNLIDPEYLAAVKTFEATA